MKFSALFRASLAASIFLLNANFIISSTPAADAIRNQEDLPNFHIVHNYLLRGGQPGNEGLKKLHNMGVATIIDLRAPSERTFNESKEAAALGMKYLNLPMSDKAPTDKQISEFETTIAEAQKKAGTEEPTASETLNGNDKFPGSVFVHCAHGSDRTGCMIGIWRVKHDGWSYDKAYEEMRRYWFGIRYHELSNAVREAAPTCAERETR